MKGKLYGVGVGPGDPELLTLKAVRIIKEADVVVVPGAKKEETVAYKIALGAVPELAQKHVLEIAWPMTKDMDKLQQVYEAASDTIANMLDAGKMVVFLTLGDPCIYSTYLYIHELISRKGYDTELINGIPSFCAVAARLNSGLVERDQRLHVIPTLEHLEEDLQLTGTKVLMKSGKQIGNVKEELSNLDGTFAMIENCGMENESIVCNSKEIPENLGYYVTILLKER
ncbi:MAG: precorrin-2 C(20)-methyltransferase [Eubacterium sp.]|nr:precorrin-2 C(20)-methyltransferase [Eubacterium sp.]